MATLTPHLHGPNSHVAVHTIATFPIGSFLENLAVRRDGTLLISNMANGRIYYLNPTAADPQSTVLELHNFNKALSTTTNTVITSSSPYGSSRIVCAIVESPMAEDIFYTVAGVHGTAETWSIFSLDLRSFSPSSGASSAKMYKVADVPSATWLNGATILPHSKMLLMADSAQGKIFSCDLNTSDVSIWLDEVELLGKPQNSVSEAWPGINGLQHFRGFVFGTVSEQFHMVKMRVDEETGTFVPGSLEVAVKRLGGDDLAFDQEGNGFVATNPQQSVMKFPGLGIGKTFLADGDGEDGRVRVVGGMDIAETAGPTAVAFGRGLKDSKSLYITTTGGLVIPVGDGPGLGRVVKAEVGTLGEVY